MKAIIMNDKETGKRIGVRLSASQDQIIEEAATAKGISVSAFVRMAALEKAAEILGHQTTGKMEAIKQ
jgi:uncharacterized protein (DUF1778 family)